LAALALGSAVPAGAAPTSPTTLGAIGSFQRSLDDPAGRSLDFFGSSVAISPSGNVLVVGADGNSESTPDVYVYVKGASGFRSSPTVTLPDPSGNAFSDFGGSVAVSGDTIVVGSDYGTSGESGGLAYIYVKGATGWPTTPTATLHDPGTGSGDMFGHAVAVSGTNVVVGAPGTDGTGTEYIYAQGGGVWPTTPTVISPNPDPAVSNSYGLSVAASGRHVVVGAWGLAAIESVGPGGRPANINRVLLDPAGASSGESDAFGYAVGISGTTTVVTTNASVAYVYQKGTTAWPTTPTTTLPDPPGGFSQDNFGISVSVSPVAIVIGDNDSGANGGGQAYIYTSIDGTWLSEPTATLSDPGSGSTAFADEFGKSVSVNGTTAVVGAPGTYSDIGNVATGATYLYSAVA
jgi:hypothetical protein